MIIVVIIIILIYVRVGRNLGDLTVSLQVPDKQTGPER